MVKKFIKIILSFSILSFTLNMSASITNSVSELSRMRLRRCFISYVSNLSKNKVQIDSKKLRTLVPASSNLIKNLESEPELDHVFKLKQEIPIPFISIVHYLKQFRENIPFVPKSALKIRIQDISYYLWQNESGLICAPAPENCINIDWKAIRIFDPININLPQELLKLCLTIDKDNKLTLT